jgi:hypothetical protein
MIWVKIGMEVDRKREIHRNLVDLCQVDILNLEYILLRIMS